MSQTREIHDVVTSVRSLLQNRRSARAIVEEVRHLAYYPLVPTLFDTILNILQQLKAQRKEGEENKAIRFAYQYISALANAGYLDESQATVTMIQLERIDLRDELLSRQLAACMLWAELSALFPNAICTYFFDCNCASLSFYIFLACNCSLLPWKIIP